MMAILNAKENQQPTTHTELSQVLKTDYRPTTSLEPLLAGILIKKLSSLLTPLETQLCSRLEPPYLCYGFLIYFLLFHVHCFFWLQCMMDVYEKNVSLGKQLQFVNLKMLVLTHLYFYSHIP